jgi:hypothetical protein
MSVYKKLNEARIVLQNTKLTKSGHNKFAGYQYFELGDFLPTINKTFSELGLCGVVSYGIDVATLTITDIDDGSQVFITSPMAEANLKGCHPIQNLGAVETYTRRYLWVTAMEIVEHDAIDSSANDDGNAATRPPAKPVVKQVAHNLQPPAMSVDEVNNCVQAMIGCDDFDTLKGIYGGAYNRANDTQKATLSETYNTKKSILTKAA